MRQLGEFSFDSKIDRLLSFAGIDRSTIKYGGEGGKKIKLLCLLPGHKEVIPSLHLDRQKGFFRCFGCGKKGTISKLGKFLGIDLGSGKEVDAELEDDDIDPFSIMNGELNSLEEVSNREKEIQLPPHLRNLPPGKKWRRMPATFLSDVGGKLWYDTRSGIERVWFPCIQDGACIGWFARIRSEKDKKKFRVAADDAKSKYIKFSKKKGIEPLHLKQLELEYSKVKNRLDIIDGMKYRNNDKQETHKILFPLEYVAKTLKSKSVVLVEGQVDALWLIYNGIPALAILGTNNWSDYKQDLLVAYGFQKIVLAMDGDKAGRRAQKKLYSILKKVFPSVAKFKCPDGKDPAKLNPSQIKDLKNLL